MTRRPARPALVATAALAAVSVACGGGQPTVEPHPRAARPNPLSARAHPRAQIEASSAIRCSDPPDLTAADRRAVHAYLERRFSDAAAELGKLAREAPRDRALEALRQASEKALERAASEQVRALAGAPVVRLSPIALEGSLIAGPTPAPLGIRTESSRKNHITDYEAWFEVNQLVPVSHNRLTELLPETLSGARRTQLFHHPDHLVGYYETGQVVITARDKAPLVFDAGPAVMSGPVPFSVTFGQLVGDVLVLQIAYNGYAQASGGKNGYLAAFRASDGGLLWSSEPLRGNLAELVVSGPYIISGYGFTAEDDHLFVTALSTGALLEKIPLDSGPSFVLQKEGKLYVRTYDHDYVFVTERPLETAASAVLRDADRTVDREHEEVLACLLSKAVAALRTETGEALIQLHEDLTSGFPGDIRADALASALVTARERLTGGPRGTIDLLAAPLVRVDAPPFERVRPGQAVLPAGRPPRFVRVTHSQADPVRSLDHQPPDGPWYIAPIDDGKLPEGVRQDIPTHYATESLQAVIPSGDRLLLVYGGRYLAVLDTTGRPERVFDLDGFRHPPRANPAWAEFAVQDLSHAQVVGETIYLCNGGGSYAKEVYGKKGFLSAITLETGALIWRSAPLVCNANVAFYGDYIVTGYGFTEEPDFLHLVRRSDGDVVRRERLRTGPDTIEIEGNRVLVETYGDTYLFELKD